MGRNKKYQDKKEDRMLAPKLDLAHETKRGIAVVIFIVLALIAMLSLAGVAGSLGKGLFRALTLMFGVIAYVVPVILLLVAASLFRAKSEEEKSTSIYTRTYVGTLLMTGSIAGLIHMFYLSSESAFAVASEGRGGGYFGALFAQPSFALLGFAAGSLLLFAILVIGVLIAFDVSLVAFFTKKAEPENTVKATAGQLSSTVKINGMAGGGFSSEKVVDKNKKIGDETSPEVPLKKEIKVPTVNVGGANSVIQMESIVLEDRKDWKLPQFDLLEDTKTDVDSGNIEVNLAIIKKTLADFGIEVEMGEVNVGPTVTQYTFAPEAGVKLSQIAALQGNLAMALSARSLRMELPIPGKALVGVEVPNKTSRIVRLREVMQTENFVGAKTKLLFALGRDVAGQPMFADLSSMPHMLVAGASGKGKSVAMNSFLVSLLYRNTPQDVKFIIVDPKRVEMTPYNGIPHLLTPVITEPDKAVNALKWAVAEMERRYKLLSEAGFKNIAEYNGGSTLQLPYIVIVVDELADLMAVAKADVESTIVRLAQMARAVGIHLVLATQRPSVDVLTGLIKANITSRIAFAVASQTDSRTILDAGGAEKLLGNGDMLFISAEFDKPKRIQGAYLGGSEIKKVVDFFKQQTGAVIYNEEIVEKPKRPLSIPGMDNTAGEEEDDLFEEAKEAVTRAGKASASLLQRRLRVGYARAARLLDILEERGIIGPGEGAKPREVYGAIPPEERAEYGVEEVSNDRDT